MANPHFEVRLQAAVRDVVQLPFQVREASLRNVRDWCTGAAKMRFSLILNDIRNISAHLSSAVASTLDVWLPLLLVKAAASEK